MTGESSTRAQGSGAGDGAVGGGLESILGPNSLHTDFAPIVDLLTNEVIGYEVHDIGLSANLLGEHYLVEFVEHALLKHELFFQHAHLRGDIIR